MRNRTMIEVIIRSFEAVFMMFLFLFSFWLMFHTFGYDPKSQSILISSKVWSDFGAHIPLIRSFSLGDNWNRLIMGEGPEYPLFPGEPIRYHFLFYLLVGLLEKIGVRIDWALNVPSALGFFLLLFTIYLLARELFRSRKTAVLSVIFFLLNGSLSFLRFFQTHPLSSKTIDDIVATIEFPSFGPWGPGDVSAFWNLNIYTNQRHLGLASGVGIALIYILLRLEKYSRKKQFLLILPVAFLLGLFPYFHQPMLLLLGSIWIWYFLVFPRLRMFLAISGVLGSLLIIPQVVIGLSESTRSFAWYPGYLIHDQLSFGRFIVYWINNLGIHTILIPLGFLLAKRRVQKALFPIILIFIGANLLKVSVEPAASHKFFNFALILGQMLSAFVILRFFKLLILRHWLIRLFAYWIIGLLILLLTLSGLIDFFAVKNDTKGPLNDIAGNPTALWILRHTAPDAVFLNSSFFFHPASLAGRKIFMGWPYFSWSAGYDTYERLDVQKSLLEATKLPLACHLLTQNGIEYIVTEKPYAQTEFLPNYEFFETHFPLLFVGTHGATEYKIYSVNACR